MVPKNLAKPFGFAAACAAFGQFVARELTEGPVAKV
jgi:hypothetical protein